MVALLVNGIYHFAYSNRLLQASACFRTTYVRDCIHNGPTLNEYLCNRVSLLHITMASCKDPLSVVDTFRYY
jgi:hypothetical protein